AFHDHRSGAAGGGHHRRHVPAGTQDPCQRGRLNLTMTGSRVGRAPRGPCVVSCVPCFRGHLPPREDTGPGLTGAKVPGSGGADEECSGAASFTARTTYLDEGHTPCVPSIRRVLQDTRREPTCVRFSSSERASPVSNSRSACWPRATT